MLPAVHRMRRSTEFSSVVGNGARARRGVVIVHHRVGASADPARVGLVVGKAVGNSVHRHRVSRRLRAQLAIRLPGFPAGSAMVVRALPGAAAASSRQLGADLDAALRRLRRSPRSASESSNSVSKGSA